MRKRNNVFAEAFAWLKKNWDGIRYQKDLAAKIGVSEDTITRIMRDQTEVTDDFLCKFNEAFDNVFNYQWLRGEEPYPMLYADVIKLEEEKMSSPSTIDISSIFNSALAKADETIESLKREIHGKDELIQSLRDLIASKEQLIAEQKARLIDYRRIIDSHRDIIDYPFPIGAADNHNSQSLIK